MRDKLLPTVTIVIPVFNGEKYIKESVESVLDQDYPHIELIVLDDGSRDGTAEILKQYGNRFFWESHDNIGQAATLNKGWKMAKGQILSYLSADDQLLPPAVGESVKYLQENQEVVMTYCDFNLIDPHSKIIKKVSAPDYSYHDLVINMICQPGPGVFFTREAFETAGGWNPAYRQMPDYEYWLRLGLTGEFYRIPQVLAAFRVHPKSQSYAKGNVDRALEPVRIMTEYFQRPDIPAAIRSSKSSAFSKAYLSSARLHWRSGRSGDGLDMLKMALKRDFTNVISIRALRLIFNAVFNRFSHRILWNARSLFSRASRSQE